MVKNLDNSMPKYPKNNKLYRKPAQRKSPEKSPKITETFGDVISIFGSRSYSSFSLLSLRGAIQKSYIN